MISLDKTICQNLDQALSREWLETNGLGGFACGTVAGANTRRYHGLLTAALNPPCGRMLLLSKIEETLVVNSRRIDLSTNEYDGAIHPEGYRCLTGFRLDPFPTFTFEWEGVKLEKSIFMPHGSNTVQIDYKMLECPAGVEPQLELRPLIAFRDYHSTTHENSALNPEIQSRANLVSVQPYSSLPRLYFAHNAEAEQPEGYWYRNFVYRMERERGLDFKEDLFNPFVLRYALRKQQGAVVIAFTEASDVSNVGKLRNSAQHVDMGMLPNRFADSGETVEFNTVDATLWFFEAARAYAAATNDYEFIRQELYSVFVSIIDFHIKGTRYNIKMEENGLLNAGAPGVQLTWMDARVGDWVVTPRSGKPVEIQALWYNALKIVEEFAQRFGDEERRKHCSTLAALATQAFNRIFWNTEKNCLYDVVDSGGPDASIRPNQILAVSLHHSMLSQDRARSVVEMVERELLTPVGLRTLSPSDPRYRPHYEGDQVSRDSAYHQGTV